MPDIYQGDDLWDFSLVDPDNRRPVDYARRLRLLTELARECGDRPAARWVRGLTENLSDGRAKLYLIWRTLQFRKAHDPLFRNGEYVPLQVTGEHASKVCAYARREGQALAIVVAPRLYLRLLGERADPPLGADVWGNTCIELPRGFDSSARLRNVLGGPDAVVLQPGTPVGLPVGNALECFPVALLTDALSTPEH